MSSKPANDYGILHLQAHEDRLQALESNLSETRVDIVQLTEIVKQGIEKVSNKVDDLSLGQGELGKQLEVIVPKVQVLENERTASIARWKSIKKVAGGVLLTGLGAAVTKFGESIINLFFGN